MTKKIDELYLKIANICIDLEPEERMELVSTFAAHIISTAALCYDKDTPYPHAERGVDLLADEIKDRCSRILSLFHDKYAEQNTHA